MGFLKKFTNKLTAPEASVQLRLSNYSVSIGENLQGNLNVTSKEDFETTEVRCELACIEQAKVIREVYDAALKRSIPRVVDESAVIYFAKPQLCGPTHFANAENRSIPININVPAGAKPTYVGVDRRVTWTIKGVLAVDGRPDRTTETCEIQVIVPTVEAQKVTAQRDRKSVV
jgi:hypothetical protein